MDEQTLGLHRAALLLNHATIAPGAALQAGYIDIATLAGYLSIHCADLSFSLRAR